MPFSDVLEQKAAKKVLLRQIAQERVSHAYLFVGPEGTGKTTVALSLAQALNCLDNKPEGCGACTSCTKIARFTHPDVRLLFAVPSKVSEEDYRQLLNDRADNPILELTFAKKSSISIAHMREIKEEISLGLFEGTWKTVIIREAEQMTLEAANSLLKVLEEPRERTTLILTSCRPQALLPTVRSRCQTVRFLPLSASSVKEILLRHADIDHAQAELAAAFAQGSVSFAARLVGEDIGGERELAIQAFGGVKPKATAIRELAGAKDRALFDRVVRFALGWYRDLLLITLGKTSLISNVDKVDVLEEHVHGFDFESIRDRIHVLEQLRQAIASNANPVIAIETIAAAWKDPERLARCSLFAGGGVDNRWWNW
jgi:DNA polymerase-3 subunit delta'